MTEAKTAAEPTIKAGERIIVALDVDRVDEARQILGELKEQVGAFKIGLQLFTAAGPAFVRELTDEGIKVFLDLKFHDIPNTVAKAAVEATRLRVWMFNVHTLGGSEMMRRTVSEVDEICERESIDRPKIIGVTVLTSSTDDVLHETGIQTDAVDQVSRLTRLAAKSGLDGVVASPHEVNEIRKSVTDPAFLVVTPGVRPESATNDDQKRVMTPGEAVAAGSDYLVIGRPVTAANDRRAALKAILVEIADVDR